MLKHEPDPQLSSVNIKAHLVSTELFKNLEDAVLDEMATQVEIIRVPGGEPLFQQGDPGDSLYIVINGRLRVTVNREREYEEVVAEVGRDEMIGEMSLLTGENRSASVRAIRDTTLLRLSNEGCHHIAEKHPFIVLHIARTVARRLSAMNRAPRMVTALVNITLVGTNPKVDLSTFATQLTEALGSIGETLHLSSRRIERLWESERMGQPSLEVEHNIKLENWLNEQESKYRFIIYEVDVTASHWTRRCLRQADRILLIGDTELPHDHGPLETELPNPDARRATAGVELVLVHPPEQAKFQNTDKWLEIRHVSAHYHVRWGVGADFARLARLLTDHGIGLVLGGGGLRGLAHIGVLRALQESNITIDFIGGTSMGAIMAAQYAMGWDYDTSIRANRKMWSDSWPMNDYTVPFMACLSGQKLDHALHQMFGETRIEDLAMRYFSVSTNLTTAVLAVHQEGLLWKRLRASCSLPGIVPPEFDNDSMLVDGAVLNNVPGDIMKKLCGGKVVAVDVSPREDLVFQPQCPERPPTKQIFWNQVNPFGEKLALPSLFDIVARSSMISSASNANVIKAQVDLYVDIPMDQFGMSDVKSFDQIIDTGYQFACQQIETWKHSKKS